MTAPPPPPPPPMPATPRRQRCHQHPEREAVAKCRRCGSFFCRECITEHDHQLICATCLAETQSPAKAPPPRWFAPTRALLGAAAGVLLAWAVFYFVGSVLLRVPHEFQVENWATGGP